MHSLQLDDEFPVQLIFRMIVLLPQPALFAGRLELRTVDFSYPTRPNTRVLNGISLKVNPARWARHIRP